MAFQLKQGGVITGLGTSLFLRNGPSSFPKTPKTIIFRTEPVKEHLKFGLKSIRQPKFHVKSNFTFSYNISNKFNSLNQFQSSGFQKNRNVLTTSVDLFPRQKRSDRFFSTSTINNKNATNVAATNNVVANEVSVIEETKDQGQKSYQITIPLGDQKFLFNFDGQLTLKNFIEIIKEEDSTVKNFAVTSKDGIRISSSTRLSDVFSHPFNLKLNNNTLSIVPKKGGYVSAASLNDYEKIYNEIVPLMLKKYEIDSKSEKHANVAMYVGLGLLIAQWSFLARLTWWEFNWDIMEPVTYFVTFGTAVLGYFYFAVTRREYTFGDVRENILRSRQFKQYMKQNFPIEDFYTLEHQLRTMNPEAYERLQWEVKEGIIKLSKPEEAKPASE